MAVASYIDGINVTNVALEGSLTRKLNRPAQATIRIPFEYTVGNVGSRLKIVVDGVLSFHGQIMTISDEGGEDAGYTEYVAMDPMELWKWRPARDEDGDFSDPKFMTNTTLGGEGPAIIRYLLENSEDAGGVPTTAEGPLFINYGFFEPGGTDLSGAPTNFPMTIADVANMLTSTGELDIILSPADGANMATVSCYNGDYGTDLSGSVNFQYATGSYNIREIRQVIDMTNLANKIWYYLGPKESMQRWHASITGGSPDVWVDWFGPEILPIINSVNAKRMASRDQYGVRMDIPIHDSRNDEGTIGKTFYVYLWLLESWIRASPRQLVHFTPIRGYNPNAFGIGDLVGVQAGSYVRGGFSGVQRIFEYTVTWDENGVTALTEIVTSASQEGI